jgi:replicative DNA helicase
MEQILMHYNQEAEQALLGYIIKDNDFVMITGAEEEDFLDSNHKKIFSYINSCIKNSASANQISLVQFFESLKLKGYISELLGSMNGLISPTETLKILRELRHKRELEEIVLETKKMLLDASKNSQEIKELIIERLEAVSIKSQNQPVSFGEAAREAFAKDKVVSISSGYKAIDEIINGFDLGDLVIIAGRPAMGKSALVANMALRLAKEKNPILFISLEMKAGQISKRMIACLSSIHLTKLKNNNLTTKNEVLVFKNAITLADSLPITIEDNGGLTLPKLRYQIKRFVNKTKGKVVIIDYLQLIKHKTKGQRVDDVTEITNTLKDLAMEFNIVIIALSQLSRAVESRDDKRPMLSDLRESGSIEQDASVVMFTFRPEYYLERQKPDDAVKLRQWESEMQRLKGVAYAMVAKVRDGKCGDAKLHFEGEFQRFTENNF